MVPESWSPIASTPGSSSSERPGLDNITSQPWFDTTCPRTTASSTLSCLSKQQERYKAEVSTSWGGTGASCVGPWLTCDNVKTWSFLRGWARCRGDWRSGTINSALSTPSYLLVLMRELSHVPRGLTEIAEAKQVRKNEPTWYFAPDQKKGLKIDPHVWNLRFR